MFELRVYPASKKPFTHPLPRGKTSIGRSRDNDLAVLDRRISRQHCIVAYEDGRFFLEDSRSKHGTYLNGSRVVKREELLNGDCIRIGDSEIQVVLDGAGIRILDQTDTDEFDTEVFDAESLVDDTAASGNDFRLKPFQNKSVNLLRDFGLQLLTLNHVQPILETTLDFVGGAIPAHRGGLILRNDESGQLELKAARSFGGEETEEIKISRSIVNSVFESKASLLTVDPQRDPRFEPTESLQKGQIHSAICSPLWSEQNVVGLIYMDRMEGQGAFDREELSLITSVANMVGLKVENLKLCEEALEKRALAEHLAVAAQIQKDLLPAQCPEIPGLDIAAFQVPCFQVGGDYYDFFRLPGERLACAIADVSGKGPGPALLMATLRAFLIAQIRQGRNPKDLTRDLNNFIHESSDPERYISFFYAELESDGRVQFVNAGHHPPMIIGGAETEELGAHGLPLGFMPDLEYEGGTAKLESGDILVLFTDGITDRENQEGNEFGQQRLQGVVRDVRGLSAKEILESSLSSVFRFGEDQPRQDDETLVIIKKI